MPSLAIPKRNIRSLTFLTHDKDFNRTVTINGTIQGYTLEPDDDSKTDASADQLSSDNFLEQTAHNAYINASGGLDKELPHAYPRALDSTKFPSGEYLTDMMIIKIIKILLWIHLIMLLVLQYLKARMAKSYLYKF